MAQDPVEEEQPQKKEASNLNPEQLVAQLNELKLKEEHI